MINRRDFLKATAIGPVAFGLERAIAEELPQSDGPLVVSTWAFGAVANEAAWARLDPGAPALDAVIDGVAVAEADPDNHYVGLGGYPDCDGHVTLDACVMDQRGEAGAGARPGDAGHPAAGARGGMDRTPPAMPGGAGAKRFAPHAGFPAQPPLTTGAAAPRRQKRDEVGSYKPEINAESHDTISMLAIDRGGDLSGACTTSGMKWKMSGRVGDSPIIGAALFVDNAVGAACATGLGEAVMKTCGSFLVVENMRRGMGPEAACRDALQRIADTNPHSAELQVGYIALTRDGRVGGHAIQPGFSFAVRDGERVETIDAPSLL
ncbi:isoaspartyl peptidase/L-asparaginase [bacterium]|nr:isoaspartyl peptidase/L-asparaginase [bacterium]